MIPNIKKILYATDLTKNSLYAFYFAADLARTYDAKVIILHCIVTTLPSVSWKAAFTDLSEVFKKAKETEREEDVLEIKKQLQQFCQNVESQIGLSCVDLVSEVIVGRGHPVEEILNTLEAKGCDVIVLGAHGKGWLKQTFLGSVASSVLQRTRKPVLIVPIPSEGNGVEMRTP
jgi:nucleotide-binding universal stress UspA family protein